jgi:hypothetical protein
MQYVSNFEEQNKSNLVEVILLQKGLRCLRGATRFKKILEVRLEEVFIIGRRCVALFLFV